MRNSEHAKWGWTVILFLKSSIVAINLLKNSSRNGRESKQSPLPLKHSGQSSWCYAGLLTANHAQKHSSRHRQRQHGKSQRANTRTNTTICEKTALECHCKEQKREMVEYRTGKQRQRDGQTKIGIKEMGTQTKLIWRNTPFVYVWVPVEQCVCVWNHGFSCRSFEALQGIRRWKSGGINSFPSLLWTTSFLLTDFKPGLTTCMQPTICGCPTAGADWQLTSQHHCATKLL